MSFGRSLSSRRRYVEYLKDRSRRLEEGRDDGSLAFVQKGDAGKPGRPPRARTFGQLFRAFWRMLLGHRGRVAAALGTLTVAAVLILLMPVCTKFAIDHVILNHPWPAALDTFKPDANAPPSWRTRVLLTVAGIMAAITIVRTLVGFWGRWQMTLLTKRLQVEMRRRVFDHAVRLPLHRVHQLKSGGVSSMLRDDAASAGDLLFHLLYNPWNATVQLIGALVVLGWTDWRMLAGAIVLIPAVALTHRTWVARIRPLYRDIKATRVSIDAHTTEAFGGMRVVRGFNREAGEAGRFVRSSHLMTRQEVLTWWWSRGIDMAWQVMVPLASTGVLVYGGLGVIRGDMTVGDVMMFTAYLLMLLGPLEVLATSATEMQNSLAGFDRVLDVLEEPTEFVESRGGVVLAREGVAGRVTLRDVMFAYPSRASKRAAAAPPTKTGTEHPARSNGELVGAESRANHRVGSESRTTQSPAQESRPVIRGVSLDVAPGEMVALVGPSGAGKTTLCNLVARFHDPQGGRIELDGRDLREIDVESYRRLLGVVEQDVFLFDGSVADNIAYARRDATMAQVREAAAIANADGFIDALEQGYDTLIGERGVRLSGGQKQRLAIARAVLADPKILILDEATSNLDTESERLIQRSLARLMRGRTSFVIAHRLSTIRHADRIVVLEEGRVIETGTHDDLLARGGRYAEFLRMQVEGHGMKPVDETAPAAGGRRTA
ncbi:MAG: ABC transporter ATP-binding protein [Phycisphaerales bacterium]